MSRRRRRLGFGLAVVWLLVIAAATLVPQPDAAAQAASTPIYCILCGDLGSVDFLLNVALFLPLGLGLVLAGFSFRRAVIVAGLITFTIELLQVNIIAGRDASLGDIVANTTGAAVGAMLALHGGRILRPTPKLARKAALAYACCLAWVWAGTAWAFGFAPPHGVAWYGAWAPEFGNYERFLGRTLSVTAGGEPLLPGSALDQGRLEDAVTAQPAIAVQAVLAGPTPDLAPIGLIVDAWQRNVMLLGQDRSDLRFGVRMRASILKLRSPEVALQGGMAGQVGDTVEAEGALRDGSFELASRVGRRISTRRLPLSGSYGWSLITPWDPVLDQSVDLLTALWIVALIAPLAYWSATAGARALLIPPICSILLLGAVPAAAGFPPAHWSEWLAAVLGSVLGLLAASGVQAQGLQPPNG